MQTATLHGGRPPAALAAARRAPVLVMPAGTRAPRRHPCRPPRGYKDEPLPGGQSADPSLASKAPAVPPAAKEEIDLPAPKVPEGNGAPAAPLATASVEIVHPEGFVGRRLVVFAGIVLGYTMLYLGRLTLTYAAPVMLTDPTLGLTKTDIGAMVSAFPAAYGVSKFAGGMLGAAFSPRLMLALGLIVTSAINMAFGFTAGVAWWTALWALNGGIQGIGAPACAMLLTNWFAAKERGTWWALWTASGNLGGFLAPVLIGTLGKAAGWKWAMLAPGIVGAAAGVALLLMLRDTPEDAGYPPVEPAAAAKRPAGAAAAAAPEDKESKGKKLAAAFSEVVRNYGVWCLALAYFGVYLVRQGSTSWLVFYLMEQKGAVDAAAAAITVSGLELGGFIGGTLAGVASDWRIKAAKGKEGVGQVGLRVQLVIAYTLATVGVLLALRAVPAGAQGLQWLTIAVLGFCIYGPQMLIGLCGAELVSKPAVGASQGILGLISYMGAANAGIPLALFQAKMGWDGYLGAMIGACVITAALLLPIANAKSFAQREREAAAAGKAA